MAAAEERKDDFSSLEMSHWEMAAERLEGVRERDLRSEERPRRVMSDNKATGRRGEDEGR
jgi:hypothetical protein